MKDYRLKTILQDVKFMTGGITPRIEACSELLSLGIFESHQFNGGNLVNTTWTGGIFIQTDFKNINFQNFEFRNCTFDSCTFNDNFTSSLSFTHCYLKNTRLPKDAIINGCAPTAITETVVAPVVVPKKIENPAPPSSSKLGRFNQLE